MNPFFCEFVQLHKIYTYPDFPIVLGHIHSRATSQATAGSYDIFLGHFLELHGDVSYPGSGKGLGREVP